MQFQPTSEPWGHGWRLKNNKYHIEWLTKVDILKVDEADLGILSTNLLL